MKPSEQVWIYGVHSVRSLLVARPNHVAEVAALPEGKGAHRDLAGLAAKKGVKVREANSRQLAEMTRGQAHQGIAALASLPDYTGLERIVARRPYVVLVLDSITDPQNLGAMIRSAETLGASGIVIPKDRSAGMSPVVHKASAGAAEWLPIAQVTNLARALREIKDAGYWIYGADAEADQALEDVEFTGKVALVIGSEGSGMRPGVKKECDFLVKILQKGHTESLNASSACAIILHTIIKSTSSPGD